MNDTIPSSQSKLNVGAVNETKKILTLRKPNHLHLRSATKIYDGALTQKIVNG